MKYNNFYVKHFNRENPQKDKADFLKWCEENSITFESALFEDFKGQYAMCISFKKSSDAMLFKLRWG